MPTDWMMGLIGGLIIGLAGSVYLLMNGRIMGASGILGGLVDGSGRSTWTERAAFLVGLIGIPALIVPWTQAGDTHATSNIALLIIAGLLVGVGTRIANGCTSGHGVCGISRLSVRGIVASVIYILAGAVTIAVARGLLEVV